MSGKLHTLQVEAEWTFSHLLSIVQEVSGLQHVKLKHGAPPFQVLEMAASQPIGAAVKNGDSLVVEAAAAVEVDFKSPTPHSTAYPRVVKRPIDDDNSCLFNAIGYVLLNRDRRQADELRQIIATTVHQNPKVYTEVMLGVSPAEYSARILDQNTWGTLFSTGVHNAVVV